MWTERRVTSSLAILFLVLLFGFLLLPVPSYGGSLWGHLVGILGTLVMVYTLVYPFRKRALGKKGKQNPLKYHIYAGLIGPSLVVVHSGHSYASLNGTLAFLAMVVIVLSGLAGRYLLRKIGKSEKKPAQGHFLVAGGVEAEKSPDRCTRVRRHPPEDRESCNRCHRAPDSHGHEKFKSMIVATHPSLEGADLCMDLKQCWRCHVTHDWRHLRMMSQR